MGEGISLRRHSFDKHKTYILDKEGIVLGFFTLRIEHGLPSLVHFATGKRHRSIKVALRLVRELRRVIGMTKQGKCIIHVSHKSERLARIARWYFKRDPYAVKAGYDFYLI